MASSDIAIGIGSTHLCTYAYVLHRPTSRMYSSVGPALNRHAIQDNEFTSRLLKIFTSLHQDAARDGNDLRRQRANVVISLPGVALPGQQKGALLCCHSVFRPSLFEVTVLDDTWASLFAETLDINGISAIAGVGASVCIAQDGFQLDEDFKIDGWGPVIGDFGSAFDISVQYFRGLNRKKDATPSEACSIFPLIKNEFSRTPFRMTSPVNIQNWSDGVAASVGSEWRAVFSRTARAIAHAADVPIAPIPEAVDLIIDAANAFSHTITLAVERARSFGMRPARVVLHGELCFWSSLYVTRVATAVRDSTNVDVVFSRFGPALGAFLWACAGSTERTLGRGYIALNPYLPRESPEVLSDLRSRAVALHSPTEGSGRLVTHA